VCIDILLKDYCNLMTSMTMLWFSYIIAVRDKETYRYCAFGHAQWPRIIRQYQQESHLGIALTTDPQLLIGLLCWI